MVNMDEMFYGTLPQDTQDFSQVLRGVGRSIGDIGRGVSYYPYDLLGAPVDIINMALQPVGLGSERPVLGSDYLRNIAQSLGYAQPSTGSGAETAGRLGAAFVNPAAGARAVGQAGNLVTRGANLSADRLVQMITGNPQATAPRVLEETSMPFMQAMAPRVDDIPVAPRESFVEGVPAGQELIVHHNITPEKLNKVRKIGGMPVPSIAVSNVENPLVGFGEISLIGNPSMASPSAKNPVFGFDAYTKRAPGITYTLDSNSEKNLRELFSDVSGDVKTTTVYDLADNWNNREFNDLMRAKFLKEKGELFDPADYKDKWDYSRDLQVRVDANFDEYREWMRDFESRLPTAGVNIQEKIFRGYTPSGNRKYVEANLQNLVKEMKGGAGSENFNYGIGNLRAVATPKFKKLDEVKAARSKIVSKEEFSDVKSQIDKAHTSLMERIDELPNKDRYGYKSEDVLYEIGSARNVNMIDTFKSDVPEELKADIGIFMKQLKKLPTEYFEIKPQRAVQVSEFEGAIVPADTPQSTIDYLKDQGIERIHFYSTPQERKELFKKFGDKMFSATPSVGAGLLGASMMQDEEMY
jgi:hypothetical protein